MQKYNTATLCVCRDVGKNEICIQEDAAPLSVCFYLMCCRFLPFGGVIVLSCPISALCAWLISSRSLFPFLVLLLSLSVFRLGGVSESSEFVSLH